AGSCSCRATRTGRSRKRCATATSTRRAWTGRIACCSTSSKRSRGTRTESPTSRFRSCAMRAGATSRAQRRPTPRRYSTSSCDSPTRSASNHPRYTNRTGSPPQPRPHPNPPQRGGEGKLGQAEVGVVVDDRVRVGVRPAEAPALRVGLRLLGKDLSRRVAGDQGRCPMQAHADQPARLRAQLGEEQRELDAIEAVGLQNALAGLDVLLDHVRKLRQAVAGGTYRCEREVVRTSRFRL